tara:strand:+ start:816 stop:1100 length:285 start_codon:yes stop_codon:yes gene_type:complete
MKNWNKIFEHHDDEWPQEMLSMTVDQLLDKLKEMNLHNEYDAIENILKDNIMIEEDPEMPTFDEIIDGDPMSGEARRVANDEMQSDSDIYDFKF